MPSNPIFVVVLLLRFRSKLRTRNYFTKISLPPKLHSAWSAIKQAREEKAFISSMGVDPPTFDYLVGLLKTYQIQQFMQANNRMPNLQELFNKNGRPEALDIQGRLGLTLHYLTSTMKQKTLCQLFGISPSTVSVTIKSTLSALDSVLKNDTYARIQYPNAEEMLQFSRQIKQRHPELPCDIFGFMDGVFFPMFNHENPQMQNRYYNGWKGVASATNILVFTPDGCICFAVLNYPGSAHDVKVADKVYDMLQDHTPENFMLLADAAFQFTHYQILTPFKKKQLSTDPILRQIQLQLHKMVVQARQPAEWGMRALQGKFARLKEPLSASDIEQNLITIRVCCFLLNLCTRLMGEGNQIKAVFDGDYFPDIFSGNIDRMYRQLL